MWVCGKYVAAARSLDTVLGYRKATARWGWKVVGTWSGSILVYVAVLTASMTPPEAHFVFLLYNGGVYQFVVL